MHYLVRDAQQDVKVATRNLEGFRAETWFIAFVWVVWFLVEATCVITGILFDPQFFVLHVITLPGILGLGFWNASMIDDKIKVKHALEDANDKLMEAYEEYGV